MKLRILDVAAATAAAVASVTDDVKEGVPGNDGDVRLEDPGIEDDVKGEDPWKEAERFCLFHSKKVEPVATAAVDCLLSCV